MVNKAEAIQKAVSWCTKHNVFLVDTTLVGCVLNGLAHVIGVSPTGNRLEYAVALVRGLGGNLNESTRESFAKEVGASTTIFFH